MFGEKIQAKITDLKNNIANLHAKGLGTNLFTCSRKKILLLNFFFLNKLVHISYTCACKPPKGNIFFTSLFLKKKKKVIFFLCCPFSRRKGENNSFFCARKKEEICVTQIPFFWCWKACQKKSFLPFFETQESTFLKSLLKTLLRWKACAHIVYEKAKFTFLEF